MFKIVPLEARHKPAVLDLLFESFLPENPLTIALELKKEDVAQAFEQMVEDSLKDGFSFVALDENGVLIGCRLSELWKHDVSKPKVDSTASFHPQVFYEKSEPEKSKVTISKKF